MANITDVINRLKEAKERWVDPEEVDDGEDAIIEYIEFIEWAIPILEQHLDIDALDELQD